MNGIGIFTNFTVCENCSIDGTKSLITIWEFIPTGETCRLCPDCSDSLRIDGEPIRELKRKLRYG